jgi:uncharacterized protein (DUF1501 family)
MLTILGKAPRQSRFCDGMSRRNFLTIGSMGMGALALPNLLRAEEATGIGNSHKAVINIFLPGGPPHQDMWDIKSLAPAEIRGEFQAIKTNVPGIEIGEMFPRIASMMDKFVPIRSIVGASGGHDSFQCMHGRSAQNQAAGGWPSFGAWVSKAMGPVTPAVPPNLSICYTTDHKQWGEPGGGGYLGLPHAPFALVGGRQQLKSADNMVLQGISLERLQDRTTLLNSIDGFRRQADTSGQMVGLDAFTTQAVGILTSSKLTDAMDLSKEDPATVARYGQPDPNFHADGAPKMTTNFLIARRLVEAGARVVSLNFSRWDWHGQNFAIARIDMPLLDAAVSSLVEDLEQRGMLDDVSVVVWGEFGRTPQINSAAGRDHWPRVSCALLAGGGIRAGQVIGATNRLGEEATDRPVTFEEVHATLYHNLGLNMSAVREFDLAGRPYHVVSEGVEPIREVI